MGKGKGSGPKDTTTDGKRRRKKRRGLWWKIPLGLLAVLAVVLVVVIARLPSIVLKVANRKLPELLHTDARIEGVDISLKQGRAALRGLHIAQPEGFGEEALLEVDQVAVQVDLGSLRSPAILIQEIELDGLRAHLVKNRDGVLNVTRLAAPPAAGGAGSGGPDPELAPNDGLPMEDSAAAEEAEASKPLHLLLGQLALKNISLKYTDESAADRPITMVVGDLAVHVAAADIRLAETPVVMLGEGTVTVQGVEISQPQIFGDEPMFSLARLHLDAGKHPFDGELVRLERLEVEGFRAQIARLTNGVMNVQYLGGPPEVPPAESGDAPATAAADEDALEGTEVSVSEPDDEPAPPPSVGFYLAELAFSDFGARYRDAALADEPVDITVRDFSLAVDDLRVFMPESWDGPDTTSARVEAAIEQGEAPAAQLGLLASLGEVGAGIPDLNLQAVLSGFLLDRVGSLIPPGTRTALGADGLDVQVAMALTAETIDVDGQMRTDRGHVYPMRMHGPLSSPEVDLGPVVGAVAGRLTGGAVNLASDVLGTGGDLAASALGGAKELTGGAADAAKNLGGGLLSSIKSVAKLDLKGVGEGLQDATVGTVGEVADSTKTAAGDMAGDVVASGDSLTGGARNTVWLEALPARHEESMEAAAKAIKEMPFPPPALDANGAAEVEPVTEEGADADGAAAESVTEAVGR